MPALRKQAISQRNSCCSTETKPAVTEPSKPVLPDSTKSVNTEPEDKDKTVIVASTSAAAAAVGKKPKEQPAKVGWVWWIPPAILGWIGGLLSWFANKDSEPKTARNMLFGGIGMSVLHGIVALILVITLVVPAAIKGVQKSPVSDTKPPVNTTVTDNKTKPGTTSVNNPPTNYKLTPINSQAVEPSDTDQTVGYSDKLQVTIPGGQLKEAQKLTISSVTDIPDPISIEKRLYVYDISFEKQHVFGKDLTFSFSYDPASLPAGSDPAMVLKVSSLDEENGIWVYVPASIDPAHNMISVQTLHNGCWQVSMQIGNQQILLTDHMAVYYNPEDFGQNKVLRKWKYQEKITAGTITPEEQAEELSLRKDPVVQNWQRYLGQIVGDDDRYYQIYQDAPRYIVDIAYYAENAWEAYFKATGKQPIMSTVIMGPVNRNKTDDTPWISQKIISSHPDDGDKAVQRLPIYVDKSHTKDPMYKSDSKAIYMGFNLMFINLPELTSHEVFHAVQNVDYYMTLTNNLITNTTDWAGLTGLNEEYFWWLESTAEYAAYKIAFPVKKPFHHKLSLDYLAQDFFSPDVPNNRIHTYKNAWFLDYLVNQQHVSFAEMYNNVAAGELPKYELTLFIQMNAASSLNDAYRLFADYLFFDTQSPIKWDQVTAKNTTLKAGEPQVITFTMPAGLTANQKGMTAIMPSGADTRTICLKDLKIREKTSLLKDSPYLSLATYKLKGNQRDDAELINSWDLSEKDDPGYTEEIELSAGDGLYFTVTCYGSSDGTELQFSLEDKYDLTLSIIPPPEVPPGSKGTTCVPYTFQAKPERMPPSVTYKWYIDDSEISSGTDTSMTHAYSPGVHRVKVVAIWGKGDSEGRKDAECAFYIGDPKVTIKGPKEIGLGEKMYREESYTFEAQSEFVPDTATYNWTTGATGKVFVATPKVASPAVHLTVMASWDVDGCKGKVESNDMQFEIAELSVDIQANPAVGTEGKETIFTATSPHIPEKFIFSWEVSDEDGVTGVSTVRMSSPVSHTYKKAGSYAVKVTVMDKQGKTQASKQIRYTVQAAQLPAKVTIIPPPDVAAGKGVTGVRYAFVASPENVPRGAMYTWYLNGQPATGGIDDMQAIAEPDFFKPGSYTMALNVKWTDPAMGSQSVANTISFQIKSGTTTTPAATPTLSISPSSAAGGMIVNTEYTFTAVMANATPTGSYTWDVGGGNPTTALNSSSVKCKFVTAGTYTINLKATGKTDQGNSNLTATLKVTVAGNTEISKEEVQFIVYRWVTTRWSDGSTTKARQYCQQFNIQILRDNIVVDGGESIARNGAFEIVLPTGHYIYKVNGKYLNPDGVCAGSSGFDVVKGARNIFEIEDSPLTKSP